MQAARIAQSKRVSAAYRAGPQDLLPVPVVTLKAYRLGCEHPVLRGQGIASSTPTELTFVAAGSYGNAPTFQVALGDLDSDGDLDAVFSNMHAESEVWLNGGSGRFTTSNQRLGSEAHGVGIGDLDGDGDLDIFIARYGQGGPNTGWLNQGR